MAFQTKLTVAGKQLHVRPASAFLKPDGKKKEQPALWKRKPEARSHLGQRRQHPWKRRPVHEVRRSGRTEARLAVTGSRRPHVTSSRAPLRHDVTAQAPPRRAAGDRGALKFVPTCWTVNTPITVTTPRLFPSTEGRADGEDSKVGYQFVGRPIRQVSRSGDKLDEY